MEANRLLDETHYFRGEFLAARKHLEQGYEIYDPRHHYTHAATYAQDPGVAFLSYGAWLWWLLGYPEQAQKMSQKALAHGQTLPHLGSQAYALTWAAAFHQMLGEVQATSELADRAITLSVEQGFALFLGVVVTLQGWAQAQDGQIEEGLIQIRKGIDDLRATGAEVWLTNAFALLAEAYGQKGQFDKGLMALNEALEFVDKHEERWWEAELYRLRGELLLMQGAADNVIEDDFRQAIDIARKQKAKSLELRAIIDLSQLWQSRGKQLEARQSLTEIYDWFTEGFDSVDLKKAARLLRKLS
jgi:predicted ATPase